MLPPSPKGGGTPWGTPLRGKPRGGGLAGPPLAGTPLAGRVECIHPWLPPHSTPSRPSPTPCQGSLEATFLGSYFTLTGNLEATLKIGGVERGWNLKIVVWCLTMNWVGRGWILQRMAFGGFLIPFTQFGKRNRNLMSHQRVAIFLF